MTTFQLRNICYKERLVAGVSRSLDREGYILTILKFRSAETSLLIRSHADNGFERVQAAINIYLNTRLNAPATLRVPAIMTLYAGLKVNKQDRYQVEAGPDITESNVLLVNDHNELCGILNLVKDQQQPGVFWLSAEDQLDFRKTVNQQYSLLLLRKQDSEYIYRTYYQQAPMPPTNLHYYKIPVADLTIIQLEETDAVLAIDFGTSNTTAGAYLHNGYISSPPEQELLSGRIRMDAINLVSFCDTSSKKEEWIELLPTVVSVADCSDHEHVQLEYGYDALKQQKRNNYSSQSTVFHGIKRWVNGYDKPVEVMDAAGNTAIVQRSEILRNYLLHVITTAEHQFKCRFKRLHISSPVKMKAQFLAMFAELLPEYVIESEHALDEGMAVLYNTIADLIDKDSFTDGTPYKALVIDCGGGTTDLSSCEFQIEDGHISYTVDIQTTYENGDTNFGGNNITYRIYQYMKIAFANYYSRGQKITDIDSLIDIPSLDLYRQVDEYGVASVYERFEACFQNAESVLPTSYKHYEHKSRDDYYRVRSNFYFLWEMAEQMKQEFFRKTGMLRNRFRDDVSDDREHDLQVTAVERWHLSIIDQEEFREVYDCPDVVFNIKEINHLIKADIYEIVRKFLDEFYHEGRLQEYSIIKLTGQSCRIDSFREALKEFIPGRSIEFRQKSQESGKVPELKLACLKGAIRYLHANKTGAIESTITNHAPVVPYSVSAYTHNRHEKVLISSLERMNQVQGSISRPIGVIELEMYLKDRDGQLRNRYVYVNEQKQYRQQVYKEIAEVYGTKIPQDDTDSIVNGETKFFVLAENNHWGFHVVPVARQQDQLYLGKKKFFAFENDLSELDFFDGLK